MEIQNNLAGTITKLNEEIRKEVALLDEKKRTLAATDTRNNVLEEEIKVHEIEIKKMNDEIRAVNTTIARLKQEEANEKREIVANTLTRNKLHQEIDTAARHHSENVAELAHTQQDYNKSVSDKKKLELKK